MCKINNKTDSAFRLCHLPLGSILFKIARILRRRYCRLSIQLHSIGMYNVHRLFEATTTTATAVVLLSATLTRVG